MGEFLKGEDPPIAKRPSVTPRRLPETSQLRPTARSLIEIASGLLDYERSRVRGDRDPRAQGTISERRYRAIERSVRSFLEFLNQRYGQGAVGRMVLAELSMKDVEDFNRSFIEAGKSHSAVKQHMQTVRAIINRGGRPEFGCQVVPWNWDSLDRLHGVPPKVRKLPTKSQIEAMLEATDLRGRTMIWLGIGLGFGQADLAALQPCHLNQSAYDMRRGKTGIERYRLRASRLQCAKAL